MYHLYIYIHSLYIYTYLFLSINLYYVTNQSRDWFSFLPHSLPFLIHHYHLNGPLNPTLCGPVPQTPLHLPPAMTTSPKSRSFSQEGTEKSVLLSPLYPSFLSLDLPLLSLTILMGHGVTMVAKSEPTEIRAALPELMAVGLAAYAYPWVSDAGGGGGRGGSGSRKWVWYTPPPLTFIHILYHRLWLPLLLHPSCSLPRHLRREEKIWAYYRQYTHSARRGGGGSCLLRPPSQWQQWLLVVLLLRRLGLRTASTKPPPLPTQFPSLLLMIRGGGGSRYSCCYCKVSQQNKYIGWEGCQETATTMAMMNREMIPNLTMECDIDDDGNNCIDDGDNLQDITPGSRCWRLTRCGIFYP